MPEAIDNAADSFEAFRTKLDEIDSRYDSVAEQMNAAAAAGNSAQIVQLAKEHARLGRIAGPYREHRKLAATIAEHEAIAADPSGDRELRELAQAELPDLRSRSAAILDGLIDDLIA